MYNVRTAASDSKGLLWVGTNGGVFTYNPLTQEYQTFRNIDALLSIDVTALRIQPETDAVFIGCSDGVINVYSNGSWEYITAIKAKADDFSSVQINDFLFDGSRVFIAGDFGVTVYNTETQTFGVTITNFDGNRNINVYNVLAAGDRVWVATSAGVFSAPLRSEQLNLPSIWKAYTFNDGGSQIPVAKGLTEYQGAIYTGYNKDLWKLSGDTFVSVARMDTTITGVISTGTELYVSDLYKAIQFPDRIVYNQASGNNTLNGIAILPPSFPERLGLLLTQKGLGYPADAEIGYIVPNSPQSNLFMDMAVGTDGSLWAATIKDFAASGFFRLYEGVWTNFMRSQYPELETDAYVQINASPDGSIWSSSWGSGVAHLVPQADTFAITLYNTENSPLKGISPSGSGPGFEVMGETVTDANGVTWILNHIEQVSRAYLIARDKDGVFYTITPPTLGIGGENNWFYNYIAIDAAGTKWLGSLAGNEILYYNDRGTLADQSDDIWGKVDATNTSLGSKIINGIAVDKNGAVWLATDKGVYVIDNPTAVLTKNRLFTRTINVIPSQLTNCIIVDALNQKWIGTNTGVWVLNEDGTSVVDNLTKDNSPLLENAITSLATDELSGNIYIGSRSGMNSARSYAVRANLDFNSLRCFPQPFILSVDPELIVDGLAERSQVKISTVDGTLVRTIMSGGSRTVVWDGRDEKGEFVPSGVYLVSGFSETSGEAGVTKAMVIHRD